MTELFPKISPEKLTEIVSFDRENKNWKYDSADKSMMARQAEGAAQIWNLLVEKRIALLADEVGMGKTIQALSVCSILWKFNPNAKILVIAPRSSVQTNWKEEYNNYILTHYKLKDDEVKTAFGGDPVNPACLCNNFYDLVDNIRENWVRLFISKTTSFSYFLTKDIYNSLKGIDIDTSKSINSRDSSDAIQEIGKLFRQKIKDVYKSGNNPPFDLLIVDEAHYFRNRKGKSQRVIAANSFFGDSATSIPLASMVLLMTATPNHSNENDINNIVSYFDPELSKRDTKEILKEICVRRFRRLSKKGFVKYNYRKEIPQKASFNDDLRSELFFAMYQRELLQSLNKNKNINKDVNRGRLFTGYLEGNEFIPKDDENILLEEKKEENKGEATDFTKSDDSRIIRELAGEYIQIYGTSPSHPKYNELINNIKPRVDKWSEITSKSLVFVRRIPSAREIARRIIEAYDEIYLKKIEQCLTSEKTWTNISDFNRRKFNKAFIITDDEDELTEEREDNNDENGLNEELDEINIPKSKVLEIFIKRNKGEGYASSDLSTHASKFRLRFLVPYNRFSIFFSLGRDGLKKRYALNKLTKEIQKNDKKKDNFLYSSSLERMSSYDDSFKNLYISNFELKNKETTITTQESSEELETLFTIFFDLLRDDEHVEFYKYYSQFSSFQKESFANYIQKGVLFASSGIIDLYCWFLKIDNHLQGLDLYKAYTVEVRKNLRNSIVFKLIFHSVKTFKIYCEKVLCKSDGQKLLTEDWRTFNNSQPIYPYTGATKRLYIRNNFNTLFFPDVLISTSVLQEGVNLHYHCSNVIHYGTAWTPGDNEQRVGRIDRMFSLIERNLDEDTDNKSTLNICYPYIENTMDEDQVANFIKKKMIAESVIDNCGCGNSDSGKEISYDDFSKENWINFLRKPTDTITINDPYPVKKCFENINNIKFNLTADFSNISKTILASIISLGFPVYELDDTYNTNDKMLCIMDSNVHGGRHQPTIIEIHYESELSGLSKTPVYILTLKTPICNESFFNNIKKYFENYAEDYLYKFQSIKLCYDDSIDKKSNLKCYAKTELLIINDFSRNVLTLSDYELRQSFYDLIECADLIERTAIYNQDLALNDIYENLKKVEIDKHAEPLRKDTFKDRKGIDWEYSDDNRFISLCTFYKKKNNLEHFRELLKYNHGRPFLKFYSSANKIHFEINYYAEDIQEIEMKVLKDYFDSCKY